jgi:hypothetical protein
MRDKPCEWIPIVEYRDFYDVPRAFIVAPRQGLFWFFDCRFDETIDDYPTSFQVYSIEGQDVDQLPADWRKLCSMSKAKLGEVPLSFIKFDTTRRKEICLQNLHQLIEESNRTPVISA